ncbi:monooxygenase, fad-binding [Trichoderma arundinaceum]|uniref:Monooxygenase, fad-binding n=1 Tax=Trichoderma arundinaceum TaxID=490622 RepID=A0A395NTN1_TRIAR|nr:monooxygenase, fad-binding [Trichoderma arundinaceum]
MASSQKPLRILIAGAGIAGLATAISLTRISGILDLDIHLYEQAPELREIGASIALSPNVQQLYEEVLKIWGTKDTFFSSRLGKGLYTVVGAYDDGRSAEELERSITWDQAGNVQFLREKYKDWHPVIKALTELTPHARLYPNYAGDALPSWIPVSRVTLVGDAAHTHGGSFAAGGSLALDDSLALGLAFKHIFSSDIPNLSFSQENIRRAFNLYDQTRRPHTARLLSIVHGLISRKTPTFATPEEEEEALKARMRSRPDLQWLSEHDVEKAFVQVVEEAEKLDIKGQDPLRVASIGQSQENAVTLRAFESKL